MAKHFNTKSTEVLESVKSSKNSEIPQIEYQSVTVINDPLDLTKKKEINGKMVKGSFPKANL